MLTSVPPTTVVSRVRPFRVDDVPQVISLVGRCPPLDVHKEFIYWLKARFFGNVSCVHEHDDEIDGYASAIIPDSPPATIYLWQLAVAPESRGKRIAAKLIDHVARAAVKRGCRTMHFSIASDNRSSFRAFEAFARGYSRSIERCGSSGTDLVSENLYRIALVEDGA